MSNHEKINYVEFPAKDIPATKAFYEKAFGWGFVEVIPGGDPINLVVIEFAP